MKYGSVCSGIEAASVAWEPLGWEPVFFSEIDTFPRAVLAHHYPNVPCHGDFTTINRNSYAAIDVLVGGTPCQDFSLAGLRAGLDGGRGNLSLEFGRLLGRLRPQWFCWENVPGVFSSNNGKDFAGILGMFTGRSVEVPADGWRNSGVLQGIGSAYSVAWRVLDAQYLGVPQRRRRVFVVGCLGADWRRAFSVLFESHSMSGDSPPRREKREKSTTCFETSPSTDNTDGDQVAFDVSGNPSAVRVSPTLDTRTADGPRRNQGGICITVCPETADTLLANDYKGVGHNREGNYKVSLPVVAEQISGGQPPDIAPTLDAHYGEKMGLDNQHIDGGAGLFTQIVIKTSDTGSNGSNFNEDGVAYTLDTMNGQAVVQPLAFNGQASHHQPMSVEEVSPALDTSKIVNVLQPALSSESNPKDVAGSLMAEPEMKQQTFLAYGIDEECNAKEELFGSLLRGGEGGTRQTVVQIPESEVAKTLKARHDGSRRYNGVFHNAFVRRLTPKECSRLQGFPDDWAKIPWKNKPAGECPDGPQYKCYGNSMAVPVMSWIGKRIQMVHETIMKAQ